MTTIPDTRVTIDLSGVPQAAQQAIFTWLSAKEQQAIVDALHLVADKVNTESVRYGLPRPAQLSINTSS